jgi:hypothetical protein
MARRKPPWQRDELILTPDLYIRHRPDTISPLSVVERLDVVAGPFAYFRLLGDREAADAVVAPGRRIPAPAGLRRARIAPRTHRPPSYAGGVAGRPAGRACCSSPRPGGRLSIRFPEVALR